MEYDYAIDGDSRDSYDDYDASDNYNREYGDKKDSYRNRESGEEEDEMSDEAYDRRDKKAYGSEKSRAHESASSASQDSQDDEDEEEEKDSKVKSSSANGMDHNRQKDSTVQDLIHQNLTTMEAMFQVPLEYLANLRKKFDRLVQGKTSPLQFKEELGKMLDEFNEDMQSGSAEESQDSQEESSEDEKKKSAESSKKRKRSHDDSDDDSDDDDDERSKQNKNKKKESHKSSKRGDFRTGTKRVKIVDSEDKPVDLKDLANLGIKKPSNQVTHGRITLGEVGDGAQGTDKASVPLVPGRRDPVFKTKSYVPPKKL